MFNYSKQTIISVLALLALAAILVACSGPATAGAAANPAVTSGGVTVVGQGEAYGQPDQAQVQVGVETFASEVSQATSENEATVQAIMDALTAQGIDAKDIQTTNYNLWAEQNSSDQGPQGIAGYHVNNQVNVTIRDINKVGDVLAAATGAGANSIYGISFSVADPAALEEQARAAAVADARSRAAALAELGGVQLGDVQIISEVISQPINYPMGLGGGYAMEQAAAPSISPGQLSYTIQVQVTFGIK
ncbi:MAG: SIMPL domain-containing protein [Ardenticatenaceae bacterium]|nr:SIMPL domain-containing protein [Ardenticatenaceae bacterium]MCB9445616.1 SIMPL domain-containing protein [Ardenticatenaceae bacterium]